MAYDGVRTLYRPKANNKAVFEHCSINPLSHHGSVRDDSFTVCWDRDKSKLVRDMEQELMTLTKWLKDSGLKVNEQKTEMVLFYKKDCQPITRIL